MKSSTLRYALTLSVLLNLGVIAAVGYQAARQGGLPTVFGASSAMTDLPAYLKLDASQREHWHALEADFLRALDAGWGDMAGHRERLIREIFAEQPDRSRIEAEREALAELQVQQQQRVIAQLLRERDILTAQQRVALADLLVRESPAAPPERRLHRR